MKNFTPREIVAELDRYIVGQSNAKKAVAIALRNRWRRQQVPPPLRDEIAPKNIILMGPTGCGKTEIARRIAKLANAPFVKVEATKFTEVGYVGRDVDSMVRDLAEEAVKICKEEALILVRERAAVLAEDLVLDLLMPQPSRHNAARLSFDAKENPPEVEERNEAEQNSREKLRQMLKDGKLNDKEVSIEVSQQASPVVQMFGQSGMEDMAANLQDALQNALGGGRKKKRKVKVAEALKLLAADEAQKLIDMDQVYREAVQRAEQSGIIFIDEIDKIVARQGAGGADVSREGVQRDILPIVEGSSVSTKYGIVKTDHVLFIAAGAFHHSKPSDLIPELQGRFPLRVELESLSEDDFVRILQEPENSLVKQYTALLATEGVIVKFVEDGIHALAQMAFKANATQQNIGARRLYTVMERVLEDESFKAPDMRGSVIEVNAPMVTERLSWILKDEDLSKFIL